MLININLVYNDVCISFINCTALDSVAFKRMFSTADKYNLKKKHKDKNFS